MAHPGLSHDELWDDSALVSSWNDAFHEYQASPLRRDLKYHSLAKRGEKVETKQESESKSAPPSKAAAYLAPHGTSQPSNAPINFAPPQPNDRTQPSPSVSGPSMSGPPPPPGLASLPQALIGGAQNEDLKTIMMSWYYAGYYTGLYEGQQKAWASIQESVQPAQE